MLCAMLVQISAKYDRHVASVCMQWIADAIGAHDLDMYGDVESVYNQLQNGRLLIRLYQSIDPYHKFPSALLSERNQKEFHDIDRISMFINTIQHPPLSVNQVDVFEADDLYERHNMRQVIFCLEAVARKIVSAIGCTQLAKGPVLTKRHRLDGLQWATEHRF
ncbi:calponin-2-like [Babylonia areolata]|uniref:calponin-2-like n=1 Tax=Babylonia areolata TaxID=304850 RepID=UPI003FD199F5